MKRLRGDMGDGRRILDRVLKEESVWTGFKWLVIRFSSWLS
jgi:hypothetical protein